MRSQGKGKRARSPELSPPRRTSQGRGFDYSRTFQNAGSLDSSSLPPSLSQSSSSPRSAFAGMLGTVNPPLTYKTQSFQPRSSPPGSLDGRIDMFQQHGQTGEGNTSLSIAPGGVTPSVVRVPSEAGHRGPGDM